MKKICEFLNCKEEGIYPAPRSRKDITNYKYYCIEHIRDFNKSWNFFEGLTEEQFENEIRKSTTWDRPSWKFGTSNYSKKINDPFNFFNDINLDFQDLSKLQLLPLYEGRISRLGNLNFSQHLPDNYLDMLIINSNTLQSIYILHFVNDILRKSFNTL